MIIGFGQREVDTSILILEECEKVLTDNIEETEKELQKIEDKYKKLSEEYDNMTRDKAPQRYSRFFYFLFNTRNPNTYFVYFTFHHINRQHPMSPDGWGLLMLDWVLQYEEKKTSFFKKIM